MAKKFIFITMILIGCLGLLMMGCPKTVVKEEPAVTKQETAKTGSEAAQQEETKKNFEETLVVKKEPGIEGEVLESSLFKDVHFEFDKYDIRPEGAAVLKEDAALLKKYPNIKIQIEGHCDERGTTEYNIALGQRRANAAKNYLFSLGIAANRMSTISYGKEKPLDPGHNEAAWAKNRRGHVVITSK
jgi:peptidoglycan-associated lipoprotein